MEPSKTRKAETATTSNAASQASQASKAAGSNTNRPIKVTHLARIRSGAMVQIGSRAGVALTKRVPLKETNSLRRAERHDLTRRVVFCLTALAVLFFFSLGIMGAQGHYYVGGGEYKIFNPAEVASVLYYHARELFAQATHTIEPKSAQWLQENVAGFFAIPDRAKVLGITLISAMLLAISGMLYQNIFRNPLAGPGILGVTTGTSFGVMLLVLIYESVAPAMLAERYALCYGFGLLILVAVLLIGRKMSGATHSLDVVSMIMVASMVTQLFSLITSYVTLYVFDDTLYQVYYNISQMLVVDTSALSWTVLGIAAVATIIPIVLLRHHLNAVPFDEAEIRLWGLNYKRLRAVSLICGAIMILAASVHTGTVGLVSLIIPFLSRRWFGVSFARQLAGNVCLGTLFLLICRDVADLIPFVGEGVAIGNVVSLVALPVFLLVVALQQQNSQENW